MHAVGRGWLYGLALRELSTPQDDGVELNEPCAEETERERKVEEGEGGEEKNSTSIIFARSNPEKFPPH